MGSTPLSKVSLGVFLALLFLILTIVFRSAMEHAVLLWPLALLTAGLLMWAVVSLTRPKVPKV